MAKKKSAREKFQDMLDDTRAQHPDWFGDPDDYGRTPQWVIDAMASGNIVQIDMEGVRKKAKQIHKDMKNEGLV